jgi:hypothetical protein
MAPPAFRAHPGCCARFNDRAALELLLAPVR